MTTCFIKPFILITLLPLITYAADDKPKPEDTEQWEPVPKVITPGPAVSPAAPSDAIILFDGQNLDEWVTVKDKSSAKWTVHDGIVTVLKSSGNIETKKSFTNYQLHLEFSGDAKPAVSTQPIECLIRVDARKVYTVPSGGNFIQPIFGPPKIIQAASIYKQSPPLVNACRKPGEWQTYDVLWTAPTFNDDGSVKTEARVTVFHNDVLVQNDYHLTGETAYIGKPQYKKHGATPIKLQAHGDPSPPISFRNIWIREL